MNLQFGPAGDGEGDDDEQFLADVRSSLEARPGGTVDGGGWTPAGREALSTRTWEPGRPGEAMEVLPATSFTTEDWPIADYEPLHICGRGAFGQVWIVRDRAGVLRALKILDLRSLRRHRAALRELEALRRYCRLAVHPHLISIFHIGQTPDCLYYTMELADDANTGEPPTEATLDSYVPFTLRERLHRAVPSRDEAVEITHELLHGLRHLHEADLVHRDVKPENVVFVGSCAKLADIGMTTALMPEARGGGTPGYMPPDGRTDGTADTYALAKVLFEVLAWPEKPQVPWVPSALLDPESNQARRLNAFLIKGCAGRGDERFAHAGEMLAALEPCRVGPTIETRPPARVRVGRRRSIGRWAGAAALALAFAAASYGLWSTTRRPVAYVQYVATIERRDADGNRSIEPLSRGQTVRSDDGLNLMCRATGVSFLCAFLAQDSTADRRGIARVLYPPRTNVQPDVASMEQWHAIPGPDRFLYLDALPLVEGPVRLYLIAARERESVAILIDALQRQLRVGRAPISGRTPGEIGQALQVAYQRGPHRTERASPAAFEVYWKNRSMEAIENLLVHTAYEAPSHVIVRSIDFVVERSSAFDPP